MHKRNITLTALVLAAIIALAFFIFPGLNHSDVLGIFYFPAILLAVVLSGGSHSPSEAAGWSAFVAYTLVFGVAFLVCYVLLLEMYLLRQAIRELDQSRDDLRNGETHSSVYLRHIGNALKHLEVRRRKHFLLDPVEEIELGQESDVFAAHAIANQGTRHPVARLMRRLESHISDQKGGVEAKAMISRIRNDASELSRTAHARNP